MKFTKMHGAGNDYVYVDCFAQPRPENPADLARRISHRRFGVGGDGLILIEPSDRADARMRMFNADGSQAEMCGNGLRCVAKYVYDHGIATRPDLNIETGAGVLPVRVHACDGRAHRITVDMGRPVLDPAEIPTTLAQDRVVDRETQFGNQRLNVTCVSMGNPHCVVFVPSATDALVLELGPVIETDPRFPRRTNVEFVEVLSPTRLRQRTWERGAGETWACGTGASAVCVAGVVTGRSERKVQIELLGGTLDLEWDAASDHVLMTGPAVEVFQGEWPDDAS